ncbi:tetratricopeptide repeat family protein [Candidatus Kinetoplastibacterium blastocrithidii TCC012E]|uniref:Tetratricopeptide repeat family protein n=1 Tax=Candidatus Kinetoplastidibacterium blastocrithidiae TCC012E TaxID=1208922 RepID=M1MCU3_9PROT|nr:tetratricopeptide repeat family protein [Candidatus Kinetoplastibacterium blastocrithidii]AGF49605.1 tetratricopeptide repeat family protein [Candidatus Kinetoplastibacterium blastocrithidii TCC012E]
MNIMILVVCLIALTKTTLAEDYYTTQQTTKSNINRKSNINNLPTKNINLSIDKILKRINANSNSCIKQTKSDIKKQVDSLMKNKQYGKALQIVKKNKINRNNYRSNIDLQLVLKEAIILNELGKQDKAYELYKDITLLYPEIPEPWNNLAIICLKKGLEDEAIYNMNMSIICCPIYETARNNIDIINNLIIKKDNSYINYS